MAKHDENSFQEQVIAALLAHGWLRGDGKHYRADLALYPEDLLGYLQDTQPKEWEAYCRLYPKDPEAALLARVTSQLNKADPNAAHREQRRYGTLGVLRNDLKDRSARFTLCQFKPEHTLNPDTLARYRANRLRVVPELVYSPWTKQTDATGKVSKRWRIDLVLFVNGIPVVTMELKTELNQTVARAITQYQRDRLPIDPATKKPEPLLTFKRGALVHFAVSEWEVHMTTRLEGAATRFLPFNQGTRDGGKGNEVPQDRSLCATHYLWDQVLQPDNFLDILARFMHLQIEEKEDFNGRKRKQEKLIFPRYHQWDVVRSLVAAARDEGPGNRYLIQHSAGSGKSNSIAWTAHQFASLRKQDGSKVFDSVIVVTDRTVLDNQLQETISQFSAVSGLVGRINRDEGQGAKSEKLASALAEAQPIIIVTIQTFPFVLEALAENVKLNDRHFAVIADEAHSSQTGKAATKLRRVLQADGEADEELQSSDDLLTQQIAARGQAQHISYLAFTATPKAKTIELFGRVPNPLEPASATNTPQPFHVYSMRQAIEEGFILDVLRNYTNYEVAYQLSLKMREADALVESKRARVKLGRWVKLHEYNIGQKVAVIIDHFREHVMHLLNGQAKAMVVTGSRKEAVRYMLGFRTYLAERKGQPGYDRIRAMVAFSGEVQFSSEDPQCEGLLDERFTETNMNPRLKGRDMRKAFDSHDYQIMIVANKFQTGFDQPKLVAMYVDKKLGGVECVQTLSRLNRTFPGKAESGTFVLDFFNKPEDILKGFSPFYKTATLADVSDPNLVHELFEKLRANPVIYWHEVEQFVEAFFREASTQALSNLLKPASERWQVAYRQVLAAYYKASDQARRVKHLGDPVVLANAEDNLQESKREKDRLDIFKKDLGSLPRAYEFLSQIVNFADPELEKFCIYARCLRPKLTEAMEDEDAVDLSQVEMQSYRLSVQGQRALEVREGEGDNLLYPSAGLGSAQPKERKEELLSQIIARINQLYAGVDGSSEDKQSFFRAVADKVAQNDRVWAQIRNNPREQVLLGDLPNEVEGAMLACHAINDQLVRKTLENPDTTLKGLVEAVLDYLSQADSAG